MRINYNGQVYEYVDGPTDDISSYRPIGALPSPPEPPKPSPVTGGDLVRSGLQGATLGFGDELRGAAYGAMSALGGGDFGQDYQFYRDLERQKQAQFSEAHPAAAIGAEMVGGMGMGLLGGAKVAGTNLARNLTGAPLRTRMLASSGAGGAAGGLAGAGAAPEMSDIPGQALQGGAIGAVAGPLMEAGATGIQSASRLMSPQRSAERAMRKVMRRAELTPEQVRARVRKMGPDAVLADVNDAFQSKLESLVQQPGKIRTKAIKQLTKRSNRQADEILSATGEGQYFKLLDDLKNSRQAVSAPLYRRAYERGVEHTDELEDLFQGIEEAIPGAWNEAKKFGRMDLVGKSEAIPDLGDVRPSLRGWQAVKEYMDDQIGKFMRAGEQGKAGKILAIKRRLLDELDSQSPEYAAARTVWAGTKQFEDAMEEGMSFMRPGMTAAKLDNMMKGMTDTDRLAFREGARQSIQDVMDKAGFTHDAAKYFRNPAMTKKLRTLFGSREAAKVLRRIESASAKQRTFSKATGNSATAFREAMREDERLGQDVLGAITEMAVAGPTQAGTGIVRQAASRIPTSREATRDIIGEMLLEQDPVKQQQILQWLMSGGKPLPAPTGAGLTAPLAVGALGGLLTTP